MRFLSLFSGIGGMDLGLEWAGWECVGQVEIEPFAISVLEKHWPNVKRWTDVRELTASDVVRSVGPVDAIVGGFPCQPWSVAGKKLGASDPRHLWPEYYRLIKELRPRWVIGENVPGLLPRGADAVLADLEAQDYTCWPIVLGADNVGAPQRRKRVFFVAQLANTDSVWSVQQKGSQQNIGRWTSDSRKNVADSNAGQSSGTGQAVCARRNAVDFGGQDLANTSSTRSPIGIPAQASECAGNASQFDNTSAGYGRPGAHSWPARPGKVQYTWEEPRTVEPTVGSTVDGSAREFSRWRKSALKGLGNMVVPQVAEVIGKVVLAVDKECK